LITASCHHPDYLCSFDSLQKKAMKQQRKAQKKALKYGLPIAGAAGGAYLLHKGVKHASHGFHFGSSSSSSSSSSSEEE